MDKWADRRMDLSLGDKPPIHQSNNPAIQSSSDPVSLV